jgi:hypothetical protein
MSSAPGIRTQITRGLNALALPLGLERHESGYRESDPGLHLGKVMRCHYATSALGLLQVPILRPRPYRRRAPPLS